MKVIRVIVLLHNLLYFTVCIVSTVIVSVVTEYTRSNLLYCHLVYIMVYALDLV